MKFQLVRSPQKQINTNFGCMALSFQLILIASLLNLSSCNSNIRKVNISDVYEREVPNRESNNHTVCFNCVWRSLLVTISSFLYGINWSFVCTIWKISTCDSSEGRLSALHNLPVIAMIPTFLSE